MSNKGLVLKQEMTDIANAIREPQGYTGKNKWNNQQLQQSDLIIPSNTGFKIQLVSGGASVSPEYDINLKQGVNYKASCNVIDYNTTEGKVFCIWIGKSGTQYWAPSLSSTPANFTPVEEIVGLSFYLQWAEGTGKYVEISNLQIEEGTTATPYEPYCQYKVREIATGINTLVDTLKSYIPHTAVSGNPITVNNAVALKPKVLEFDGDSKQDSTTGKNLFTTTDNFVQVVGSTTYSILGENSLSVTSIGTTYNWRYVKFKLDGLTIGQQYKIQSKYTNSNISLTTIPFYIRNASDTVNLNAVNNYQSGTDLTFIPTETSVIIRFYANSDDALINTCIWKDIMVSTSGGEYEPYTGGIPSPNSEYKQDIHDVKSSNGTLNLGKMGKNLINKNAILTGKIINRNTGALDNNDSYGTSDYIIVKPNTNYTFTNTNTWYNACYDKNHNHLGNMGNSPTMTTLANTKYIKISFLLTHLDDVQIEEGSTATTYEPYKHDTIPFNIGTTEFASLPNGVKDKLWVNLRTGQYGNTGYVGERVLNGTENWLKVTEGFYIPTSNWQNANHSVTLANHFKTFTVASEYNSSENGAGFIYNNVNQYYIKVNGIDTVEAIKSWLATHNTIVKYELATPVTTTLGTLSQENLAKLVMYAGVNNIDISGYDDNGAEPIIELDYYTQIS